MYIAGSSGLAVAQGCEYLAQGSGDWHLYTESTASSFGMGKCAGGRGSLLCMGALAQRVWAGALCLLKGRDGLVVGVLPEAINS